MDVALTTEKSLGHIVESMRTVVENYINKCAKEKLATSIMTRQMQNKRDVQATKLSPEHT